MEEKDDNMPNPADRLRLKDRIIENIGKAVKQLQAYQYTSLQTSDSQPILTNNDWQFHKIVEHLDHALLHGLRHITNGYWVVVREFTHASTVKEIKTLQNVTTNLGRGRAWLYFALNDHLLESYTRCYLDNTKLVTKHYAKEALVLDQQRMQILLTLAAGIESVQFQLDVDMPYLDLSSYCKQKKSMSEDSDDKMSLCSMDSSASQCSSLAGSYQRSMSDVFNEGSDGVTVGIVDRNAGQSNGKIKQLVRNSCSLPILEDAETDKERMSRFSQIDTKTRHSSIAFDGEDEDVEVIRIKSKPTKAKKKSGKRKQIPCDPERISMASTNSNNSIMSDVISGSVTTPESGYRSNLECLSLRAVGDRGDGSSDNVMMSSTGTDISSNQECQNDLDSTLKTQGSHSPKDMIFELTIGESTSTSNDLQKLQSCNTEESSQKIHKLNESQISADAVDIYHSDDLDKSLVSPQNGIHVSGSLSQASSLAPVAAESESRDESQTLPNETATPSLAVDPGTSSPKAPGKRGNSADTESTKSPGWIRQSTKDKTTSVAHQNAAPTELNSKPNSCEINVDNNTKLILMLEVFTQEDEKFVKMYITCMGHTEGNLIPIFLLLTDRNMYFLTTSNDKTRFKVDSLITYKEIDYVSLSISCQYLNVVCVNRRKQFWITTGDEDLTSKIIREMDQTIRHSELDLPRLSILTDATTQRIAMKKWVANETNVSNQVGEVSVLCYVLAYWEDTQALQCSTVRAGAIRDGTLLYRIESQNKPNTDAWRPGYFVLKDNVLYLYEDKLTNTSPIRQVHLNSETCSGCRRCRLEDRDYGFEVILAEGDSILLCAQNETEQQEWLVALCQAVAEGAGRKHPSSGCLPCCCVLTRYKIIMCHEDVQTNFFRTLGSADITDVTRVLVDKGANTYCVLEFESADEGIASEKWVIYFNVIQEKERFLINLDKAWQGHFEVPLQPSLIEDNVLQRRCREGISSLKQLRKV